MKMNQIHHTRPSSAFIVSIFCRSSFWFRWPKPLLISMRRKPASILWIQASCTLCVTWATVSITLLCCFEFICLLCRIIASHQLPSHRHCLGSLGDWLLCKTWPQCSISCSSSLKLRCLSSFPLVNRILVLWTFLLLPLRILCLTLTRVLALWNQGCYFLMPLLKTGRRGFFIPPLHWPFGV